MKCYLHHSRVGFYNILCHIHSLTRIWTLRANGNVLGRSGAILPFHQGSNMMQGKYCRALQWTHIIPGCIHRPSGWSCQSKRSNLPGMEMIYHHPDNSDPYRKVHNVNHPHHRSQVHTCILWYCQCPWGMLNSQGKLEVDPCCMQYFQGKGYMPHLIPDIHLGTRSYLLKCSELERMNLIHTRVWQGLPDRSGQPHIGDIPHR